MTQLVRIDSLPAAATGGVVSIGNFDGVHVGHAALLSEVRVLASQLGGPSVAVILDPHPVSLLRPHLVLEHLTTIERRRQRMAESGIDFLAVCSIDRQFLDMTAEAFFQSLVIDRLQARGMVEGPNFFFGRGRGGNVDLLQQLCAANQVKLSIATPVCLDREMISSTRVRAAVVGGDIETANQFLGAAYQLQGIVERGVQRGRRIGFPTANLSSIPTLIPGHGVYGGYAHLDDQVRPAAIHIGPNPTFDSSDLRKVEVHVLDYDGDLYGRLVHVDFVTRVRDIAKFESPEQLKDQLVRDVQSIRQLLTPA